MNLPKVTIEQLLEAGVHFGHNIRRWNPKMEQYIFGVRNKIHIIDLRITLPLINTALVKLYEIVSKSGKVLIVGTKKQSAILVEDIAKETDQYFINKRWLGGTLTNWKTISKSINKLDDSFQFNCFHPFSSRIVTEKYLIQSPNQIKRLSLSVFIPVRW